MALFGRVETVRKQAPDTGAFHVAWEYVDELLREGSSARKRTLALTAGGSAKHELAGGVFAIEQAYLTRRRPEGLFESHRKYLDIQVVVSGEENMEVIDIADATVQSAYEEARDLIKYHDTANASVLRIGVAQCAVFLPRDVHMPCLRADDRAVLVHKSVLKVPVS